MLPLEAHAGWLLVLHTIAAAAVVAASTHLVVWMRGYRRGNFARHRGVVILATWSAILYVVTLSLGMLIYPTYKVRVRIEYLESGTALTQDLQARAAAARRAAERMALSRAARTGEPAPAPEATPPEVSRDTAQAALGAGARLVRWFDIKEHFVALGALLAIACAFTLRRWDPRERSRIAARAVFCFALGAAACAWLAGIVGILTAATRSVIAP